MKEKLSESQRQEALARLEGWAYDGTRDGITRSFRFKSFSAAVGFLARVAMAAEKRDHHPEWFNVYNRVDIFLTSHDVKGLSGRDIDLANAIDSIAGACRSEII